MASSMAVSDISMDYSSSVFSSGYPKAIVTGAIDKKYLCSHCQLILREPMQSFCGHRFCKNCTTTLLSDCDEIACPACLEEGLEGDYCVVKQGQIFPDNAMKREFLGWKVKCPNPGCDWNGSFKQYEPHCVTCAYRTELCECGQQILVAQLDYHRNNNCPSRSMNCAHCQKSMLAQDQQSHLQLCPKILVKCDVCDREILREKLSDHYNGECSSRRVGCPYGCGDFVEPAKLSIHESENALEHLRALNQRLTMFEINPSGNGQNLSTPVQVSQEIKDMRSKMAALEIKVTTQLGDTSAQVMPAASAATGGATGGDDHRIGQLEKKLEMLAQKMKAFNSVVGVLEDALEKNRVQFEQTSKNSEKNKDKFEERLSKQDRNMSLKELKFAEIEQRLKTVEVSSYDGVLLWKITDFARKRQDAISGKAASIYSPPFYTSRTGYKMCSRLYLNGDGMGKGSYVSIFFVVMRSGYDALMRWPFRQKVTMILIDQNNRDHVIDAFRPDVTSSSFRRPLSEMNVASGCPLFCPFSTLSDDKHAYVKDDTMYIKVIVDTSDLGTTT